MSNKLKLLISSFIQVTRKELHNNVPLHTTCRAGHQTFALQVPGSRASQHKKEKYARKIATSKAVLPWKLSLLSLFREKEGN